MRIVIAACVMMGQGIIQRALLVEPKIQATTAVTPATIAKPIHTPGPLRPLKNTRWDNVNP